jgi:hypothetical protein
MLLERSFGRSAGHGPSLDLPGSGVLEVVPQDPSADGNTRAETEDVVAVLDAIDHGGELAAHLAVQARTKDLGDFVAAALEQLVDGKVSLEYEVAVIPDLGDRIEA